MSMSYINDGHRKEIFRVDFTLFGLSYDNCTKVAQVYENNFLNVSYPGPLQVPVPKRFLTVGNPCFNTVTVQQHLFP